MGVYPVVTVAGVEAPRNGARISGPRPAAGPFSEGSANLKPYSEGLGARLPSITLASMVLRLRLPDCATSAGP